MNFYTPFMKNQGGGGGIQKSQDDFEQLEINLNNVFRGGMPQFSNQQNQQALQSLYNQQNSKRSNYQQQQINQQNFHQNLTPHIPFHTLDEFGKAEEFSFYRGSDLNSLNSIALTEKPQKRLINVNKIYSYKQNVLPPCTYQKQTKKVSSLKAKLGAKQMNQTLQTQLNNDPEDFVPAKDEDYQNQEQYCEEMSLSFLNKENNYQGKKNYERNRNSTFYEGQQSYSNGTGFNQSSILYNPPSNNSNNLRTRPQTQQNINRMSYQGNGFNQMIQSQISSKRPGTQQIRQGSSQRNHSRYNSLSTSIANSNILNENNRKGSFHQRYTSQDIKQKKDEIEKFIKQSVTPLQFKQDSPLKDQIKSEEEIENQIEKNQNKTPSNFFSKEQNNLEINPIIKKQKSIKKTPQLLNPQNHNSITNNPNSTQEQFFLTQQQQSIDNIPSFPEVSPIQNQTNNGNLQSYQSLSPFQERRSSQKMSSFSSKKNNLNKTSAGFNQQQRCFSQQRNNQNYIRPQTQDNNYHFRELKSSQASKRRPLTQQNIEHDNSNEQIKQKNNNLNQQTQQSQNQVKYVNVEQMLDYQKKIQTQRYASNNNFNQNINFYQNLPKGQEYPNFYGEPDLPVTKNNINSISNSQRIKVNQIKTNNYEDCTERAVEEESDRESLGQQSQEFENFIMQPVQPVYNVEFHRPMNWDEIRKKQNYFPV